MSVTTETPGNLSQAQVNIALGGAFLAYATKQRRELKKQLRKYPQMDSKVLQAINQAVWSGTSRPALMAGLTAALVQGIQQGLSEAKSLREDPDWVQGTARQYAAKLADRIHATSTEALMKGYRAQTNRNIATRIAAERVVDVFGIPPKTMNSVINVLTGTPSKRLSTRDLGPSKIKNKVDQMVADAITDRAHVLAETEEYQAKNMAKSIQWVADSRDDKLKETARVVWYTKKDERVCKQCGPMHGKYRKPDQQWTLPSGMRHWGPPAHPRCRCEQILVPEVTQHILTMTLDQAEQYEQNTTRDLVSKAMTRDGQHDPYKRDEGGQFASRDTRTTRGRQPQQKQSSRTTRGVRVKERERQATVGDFLAQQPQEQQVTAEPQLPDRKEPQLAQRKLQRRQPKLPERKQPQPELPERKAADLQQPQLAERKQAEQPQLAERKLSERKLPERGALSERKELRERQGLPEKKVTSASLKSQVLDPSLIRHLQTISRVEAEDLGPFDYYNTPFLSLTFDHVVDGATGEISTGMDNEFFDPTEHLSAITEEVARYWDAVLQTELSFDRVWEDRAASYLDHESGRMMFTSKDGKSAIAMDEEKWEEFWNMVIDDSALPQDKVLEVPLVSGVDSRVSTFEDEDGQENLIAHIDELLTDYALADLIQDHMPTLYVTHHLNSEFSATTGTPGGFSNPGQWDQVQPESSVYLEDLPMNIVFLKPNEDSSRFGFSVDDDWLD